MKPRPVVHSPAYGCDIGLHVFPTAKYQGVLDSLLAQGAVAEADVHVPPPGTRALLESVHAPEYLDDLAALRLTERTAYAEMRLTPEVLEGFALQASGTWLAARLALEAGACAHLGGGLHHAHAEHAEGFCFYNDLAVAARMALTEELVERVAVVDLDVHHGNGTAAIFADEPAVFTLSVHQEHNYPALKPRSSLDVGLEDGTGDDAYLAALAPALERVWAFRPQLVLYQAGADPFHDDQLGGLALSFEGLEARDRAVVDGCASRGIALVTTLGGGYARRLEDTVRIHATTSRLALRAGSERARR